MGASDRFNPFIKLFKTYYFVFLVGAGSAALASLYPSSAMFETTSQEAKHNALRTLASAEEATDRVTLEDLDRIMKQAGSTEGFVANKALQDRYYEALRDYMGSERFIPRESYDAIVKDLGAHLGEIEGLGERLWQTTNTGKPISMKASIARSGRKLGAGWTAYQKQLREDIDELATEFMKPGASGSGVEIDSDKMRAYASQFNETVDAHESQLAQMTRRQRGAANAEFFKKLQNDQTYKAYNAAALKRFFQVEKIQDAFGNNDADVILDNLRSLQQKPDQVLDHLDEDLRIRNASTGIRNLVLSPEALTNESHYQKMLADKRRELNQKLPLNGLEGEQRRSKLKDRDEALKKAIDEFNSDMGKVFPVDYKYDGSSRVLTLPQSGSKEAINLRPIPRRIHGIFKGAMDNECVGGSCRSLGALSIERWATTAVKDTQFYHLEADGKYKGFVQIMPIKVKDKVYGSVDWGASLLRNQINLEGENGKRPLVEPVIEKLQQVQPQSIRGLVMGNDYSVDNARVKEIAEASNLFKAGQTVGYSDDFVHIDKDFVDRVVKRPKKRNEGFNYDGSMIFDGSGKFAREYRLLASEKRVEKMNQLADQYLKGIDVVGNLNNKNHESFARILIDKIDRTKFSKESASRIVKSLQKDFPNNQYVGSKIDILKANVLFHQVVDGEISKLAGQSSNQLDILQHQVEVKFKYLSKEQQRRALPLLLRSVEHKPDLFSSLWEHLKILPKENRVQLAEEVVNSFDGRLSSYDFSRHSNESLLDFIGESINVKELETKYDRHGPSVLKGLSTAQRKALVNHIWVNWPRIGRSSMPRFRHPGWRKKLEVTPADLTRMEKLANDFGDLKGVQSDIFYMANFEAKENGDLREKLLLSLLKNKKPDPEVWSNVFGSMSNEIGANYIENINFNHNDKKWILSKIIRNPNLLSGDKRDRKGFEYKYEKVFDHLMPARHQFVFGPREFLPKKDRLELLWELLDRDSLKNKKLNRLLILHMKDSDLNFAERVKFLDKYLKNHPRRKNWVKNLYQTYSLGYGGKKIKKSFTKLMVGVHLRRAGVCFGD